MQCYMGTPCRQQYTHPGDATAQGSQICHRFFFHCTRSVISVLQQLQWLILHEKICRQSHYNVLYYKGPGSSWTSFIIPSGATVRGHNQRFLIPHVPYISCPQRQSDYNLPPSLVACNSIDTFKSDLHNNRLHQIPPDVCDFTLHIANSEMAFTYTCKQMVCLHHTDTLV